LLTSLKVYLDDNHANIHNHWLKHEVKKGVSAIEYVRTEDMIADGLTKALPTGKFEVFRDQVGLVDISEIEGTAVQITARR